MNRLLALSFCIAACTSPTGAPGAKGDAGAQGEQGAPGLAGAKGDTGAAGICDSTSCPQPTSFSNLTSVSTQSVEIANGTHVPAGLVVESGGKKTSLGGFYCGSHTSVDGDFFSTSDHSHDSLSPMRRSKKYCESACSNVAAHPCLTSDVVMWQQLGAGNATTRTVDPNPSVPMPPDGSTGWVLTPDPTSTCSTFTGGASDFGTIFSLASDEGGLLREACNVTHPLLCCF